MIDDAGPGLPDTFGGEVRTDTLSRIHREGIGFNRFHTTAMCSPTRASLLTGRNHHRIGNGQIAELANDWDGYAGEIPKSSALAAEVLKHYGYATAAFGKWHNTPAIETTTAGPFHNWPSEIGFEYFYGFLAGEASQYEPNLVRNTTGVLPPRTPEEGYHLSEDLADDAIAWLHRHQAFEPDKPFFMYWASGCLHAPHHIWKEWSDRYAGAFDDGWDAYRERVFERQKQLGWIPADAQLTPRHPLMQAWDDVPEDQRAFHRRSMEVAAGFAEHVDVQVGRIVDEIEAAGLWREHAGVLYLGRQRLVGRGPERHHQRAAGPKRHPDDPRHAPQGPGRARRPRRPRYAQGRQPVPRRVGLGWEHAVQRREAGGLALRGHPQPDGDPLAGENPSRCDPASAVPSLQRRRADDLRRRRYHAAPRGQRRPTRPHRRGEFHVRLRRRHRSGATPDAVLRDHGQPGHLPRRVAGLCFRAPGALGARAAPGDPTNGHRTRTSGSSTT